MNGRGGARIGAGRKQKHGEPTVAIRVPLSWVEFLNLCFEQGISPLDFVQNQIVDKDRIISELQADLNSYKIKFENVQNQIDDSRKVDNDGFGSVQNQNRPNPRQKAVEMAVAMRAENPMLSKSEVARKISADLGVKFETVRDWLKRL